MDEDREYDDDYCGVPMYKLTTVDNPYHPVKERDNWERWDVEHGHNTDGLVYSISGYSDYWTEAEKRRAENDAIDDIIRLDLELKYKKVLIED